MNADDLQIGRTMFFCAMKTLKCKNFYTENLCCIYDVTVGTQNVSKLPKIIILRSTDSVNSWVKNEDSVTIKSTSQFFSRFVIRKNIAPMPLVKMWGKLKFGTLGVN